MRIRRRPRRQSELRPRLLVELQLDGDDDPAGQLADALVALAPAGRVLRDRLDAMVKAGLIRGYRLWK